MKGLKSEPAEDEPNSEGAEPTLGKAVGIVFDVTKVFILFYRHRHILTESYPAKKKLHLQLSRFVKVQLVVTLELLGIESPEKM